MRKALEELDGRTVNVHAKIERYGRSSSAYLLVDVREATGRFLTDHLWVEIGTWAAGFRPGDEISFSADVA